MKLCEFRDTELVVYFHYHTVSQGTVMCLWCRYVKAGPSNRRRSDEAATKAAQRVSALVCGPWGDQGIKFHLQRVGTDTSHSHTG